MKAHRKLFFWIIVIAAIVMAVVYYFQHKNKASETKIYFSYSLQGTRNLGDFGVQSSELNSHTPLKGIVCVSNVSDVSNIDLFMPDMGHGSRPPVVSKTDFVPKNFKMKSNDNDDYGCFNVSKMEMYMPGLWQVRVFYKDGENGYFDIDLKN